MKYKPTIWGITKEVAKLKNPTATALAGAFDIIAFLGNAVYDGTLFYSCGNPSCGKPFKPFKSNAQRPLVCPKCGEEVDWTWTGKATRKIKACPQCKREYSISDNYCPNHIPRVALVEKEIPL